LKSRAGELKKEILTLYFAYRDPRFPLLPRLIIIFTVAYALSPIDLIPDFIPVLGYLDDLIILPLLISLSIKLIPLDIIKESREKAENENQDLKPNKVFAVIFIMIWIFILVAIIRFIIGKIK
jgi:uncharacterized membrane protein YkvA (DUF1232 family)